MRLYVSHLWNKFQDEMVDEKNIYKKSMNIMLNPSQRYQGSRHFLQNPKVPRIVMGFSNRAQRFIGSNYLDVDSLPGKTRGGKTERKHTIYIFQYIGSKILSKPCYTFTIGWEGAVRS